MVHSVRPATEEAFFDIPLHCEFAKLDAHGRFPDESTILRFRQRLSAQAGKANTGYCE